MENSNQTFTVIKFPAPTAAMISGVLRGLKADGRNIDDAIVVFDSQVEQPLPTPTLPPAPALRLSIETVPISVGVGQTAGFLTVREAAKAANLAQWTLYNWIKLGTVKSHKIEKRRYFLPSELNKVLSQKGLPLIAPEVLEVPEPPTR